MTDTTVIEQEPEVAPAQLPNETVTPSSGVADEWDSLLADYEARTAPPPAEPDSIADGDKTQDDAATNSELDALLREMSGPSPEQQRIDQLSGELNAARVAEIERQSKQDFEGFSRKLQDQCGVNVPDDYAKTQLLSMAAEKPELYAAWYHRHLTRDQIAAAEAEFRELEALYWKAQQAPNDDPRKQTALRQIEQRAQQVDWARNAHKVLNQAWNEVRKRASKVLPPIDIEATEDRAAIVASVIHDGLARGDIPEPPVRLGNLSDAEFREFTRKNYGF